MTNGVVIAFTSDFIPRLFHYSQYGSLDMYMNHTLSYFNVSEIETGNKEEFYSNSTFPHYCLSVLKTFLFFEIICNFVNFFSFSIFCGCFPPRYQGHRFGPDSKERYLPTPTHWELLALKFGFVVIFENVIAAVLIVIRWIIPDTPHALRQQVKEEDETVSLIYLY